MLAAGSELGRYLIVEPLGSGGMGDVYRARDRTLRRDVAIKVLNAERLAPSLRDEFIARMINEARAAASLMHPNIVTIFDVNEQASIPFIVLELVDGVPLRSHVRDTTVPLSTKLRWLGQIASGLAAAHRAGFVHRDVKPANVMIDRHGNAKLLDFGIAKRVGGNHRAGATLEGPASFATQDGSVLGTPRYMAPEQAAGAPLDARADQYAWGAVAIELLTSQPFEPGAPLPELDREVPGLPLVVARAVERALARARADRHTSMDDIVAALATQEASSDPSRPKGFAEATTTMAPIQELHGGSTPARVEPRRPAPVVASPRRSKLRPFWIGLGSTAAFLVLASGFIYVGYRWKDTPHAAERTSPSTTTIATTPADIPADASAEEADATPLIATTSNATPRPPAKPAMLCECYSGASPDGQRLCRVLDPEAVCNCETSDGRPLCPVVWTTSEQDAICSAAKPRSRPYVGKLVTGGACKGYPQASTPNAFASERSGVLDCFRCSTESMVFHGNAGDSCHGWHVNSGHAYEGKLAFCKRPPTR